jgi:hypothetical protein
MSMAQKLPARGNRQVSYLYKDADFGNSILKCQKAAVRRKLRDRNQTFQCV